MSLLQSTTAGAASCRADHHLDIEQRNLKVWHTLNVGRWCLMTARGVTGRCWLICASNTVVFGAHSLSELIALVIGHAARGVRR